MGGESQQEEPEEPEAEGARTGRTDASTGFTDHTSAAILTENVLKNRARPREGSQRRRRVGRDDMLSSVEIKEGAASKCKYNTS